MYNKKLAEKYWGERIKEKPNLEGVLNISLPNYVNKAYDKWSARLLRNWVDGEANVLDVGCGIGRLLVPLARSGCKVAGIDISPEMIKLCRKEAKKHQLNEKIKLNIGSADDLPYDSESFDVVILAEILFHLPDNLIGKVIEEASRVLKYGGVIIATANNKNSIYLKKTHVTVKQRDNGYFCTVRSLGEVNKEFEHNNLKLIFKKGFALTNVLNNFKNGGSIFSRFYRKLMLKFPYPLLPFYQVFPLLDSNSRINFFDNRLASLFFLVYRKK